MQWLAHRLALGHAWRDHLDRPALVGDDRPLAIHGVTQRIDHAADHRVAHWHAEKLPGAANFVPLVDRQIVAQNDDADGVLFEVERQADHAAGEADHLAGHHAGEAVHAGDAVAHLEHAAHLAHVDARLVLLDLGLQDGSDFVGFEFHNAFQE